MLNCWLTLLPIIIWLEEEDDVVLVSLDRAICCHSRASALDDDWYEEEDSILLWYISCTWLDALSTALCWLFFEWRWCWEEDLLLPPLCLLLC